MIDLNKLIGQTFTVTIKDGKLTRIVPGVEIEGTAIDLDKPQLEYKP